MITTTCLILWIPAAACGAAAARAGPESPDAGILAMATAKANERMLMGCSIPSPSYAWMKI